MQIDQGRVGEMTSMYANRLVCETTGFPVDSLLFLPCAATVVDRAIALEFFTRSRGLDYGK